MGTLRIVFLTDVESPDGSHGEKLCSTVSTLVTQLHYGWETVALDKLDSQEEASVEKFLHADVVMMVRGREEVVLSSSNSVLVGCHQSRPPSHTPVP